MDSQYSTSTTKNDSIWFQNPTILFNVDRIIEFFPTKDMNVNERLNAISRFSIYLSILLYIYTGNYMVLYLMLVTLLLVFITYRNDDTVDTNVVLKCGLKIDEQTKRNLDAKGLTIDQDKKLCQAPTADNPFMNVLVTDYVANPNRLPACDISDPDIAEKVEEHFDHNLYKNVDDIWNRNNQQRQYYTNPITTIPNDQDTFSKWLYNTPYACKAGDTFMCYHNIYQPMKGKR